MDPPGHPLAGTRVLEFAQLAPVPYAGLVLASLGAEVIKVESPRGDPVRFIPPYLEEEGGGAGALFCALNKGKKSVVLDL
ncbi:MAG: CoA transferase, partial [Candidatus Thermoplasmatota archaeon]|nr:CoA transferase [Candidatus Thermoplasmatota archaeon]